MRELPSRRRRARPGQGAGAPHHGGLRALPQPELVGRCDLRRGDGQRRVRTGVGVSMTGSTTVRLLAILVAIGALVPPVWAAPKGEKAAKSEDADDASDEGDGDDDASARPARKKAADAESGDDFKKQDLSGHDQNTTSKQNVFERDRFFVDKTDSSKTAKSTLVQGSITSTTFIYHESGAPLATVDPVGNPVPSASQFDRMFTDLRLQTDFRHIAAGKWDARIDLRGRVVNDPGHNTPNVGFEPVTKTRVQSGWQGDNEL